jgi:hypothetical protein
MHDTCFAHHTTRRLGVYNGPTIRKKNRLQNFTLFNSTLKLLPLSQDLTNLLLAASKYSDYGLFHYDIAQMGISVSEKYALSIIMVVYVQ